VRQRVNSSRVSSIFPIGPIFEAEWVWPFWEEYQVIDVLAPLNGNEPLAREFPGVHSILVRERLTINLPQFRIGSLFPTSGVVLARREICC
jgi:hypothetical protein